MTQFDLFSAPADPLRFPCTYPGFRYALPCGAKAGEPCRWPRATPPERFHAERRRAAGEPIKTYEELYGQDSALGSGAEEVAEAEAVESDEADAQEGGAA